MQVNHELHVTRLVRTFFGFLNHIPETKVVSMGIEQGIKTDFQRGEIVTIYEDFAAVMPGCESVPRAGNNFVPFCEREEWLERKTL